MGGTSNEVVAVAAGPHAAHPSMLGLSHIGRSPRWALRSRPPQPRAAEVPGPGAYGAPSPEGTSRFQKGPRFAFGTAGREAMGKKVTPGPGSYSSTKDAIGVNTTSRSFSMTPRRNPDVKVKTDVPGPGAHEIATRIGNGPKYSAGARGAESVPIKAPGPSDYEFADLENRKRGWGFGGASTQRLELQGKAHSQTPGPGTYIMSSAVGEGPKYSMKARPLGGRTDPSPGPGAHGGHYTSFAQTG